MTSQLDTEIEKDYMKLSTPAFEFRREHLGASASLRKEAHHGEKGRRHHRRHYNDSDDEENFKDVSHPNPISNSLSQLHSDTPVKDEPPPPIQGPKSYPPQRIVSVESNGLSDPLKEGMKRSRSMVEKEDKAFHAGGAGIGGHNEYKEPDEKHLGPHWMPGKAGDDDDNGFKEDLWFCG